MEGDWPIGGVCLHIGNIRCILLSSLVFCNHEVAIAGCEVHWCRWSQNFLWSEGKTGGGSVVGFFTSYGHFVHYCIDLVCSSSYGMLVILFTFRIREALEVEW